MYSLTAKYSSMISKPSSAKSNSTRQLIIETALVRSVKVGLEGVTLGTIAARIGMSKSGLFSHFKSKESLQLAILEEAIARFRIMVVDVALEKAEGLEQLCALFELYLNWIAGDHPAGGCPFITYVQEYDNRPGAIHDILVSSQTEWRQLLASCIEVGQANKEINAHPSPEQMVFELLGTALSFQVSADLFKNPTTGREMAMEAFQRITEPRDTTGRRK